MTMMRRQKTIVVRIQLTHAPQLEPSPRLAEMPGLPAHRLEMPARQLHGPSACQPQYLQGG